MYCICCKKDKVYPYDYKYKPDSNEESPNKSEVDMLWEKIPSNISDGSNFNRSINNGIIQIIDAGYGSTYDGDRIIIAICDDCIKENLEDATLLYYDNMYHGEFKCEKSKTKYRRRKNLDEITKK